jgi:predicted PurR-regulated permease PerM
MSTNLKITIAIIIIVLLLILIGLWYFAAQKPATSVTNNLPPAQNTSATTGNELTTSPTDTSNAALSKDLSLIDNQFNDLAADYTNVDQSLRQ